MPSLKDTDTRFRIQVVASTPERAQELQWSLQDVLKGEGNPPDGADKILSTGWLATADEALQMFKHICEPAQESWSRVVSG
jgi:hypothetical protein